MVLAACLGTRMRPLTADRPKALVEVAGRPLVDHMLERLFEAGVERVVVNLHAFADRLEAHLRARCGSDRVVTADERGELLDTGGGVKNARALLGEAPIFVANIDSVWVERRPGALTRLAAAFRPSDMDALLLLTPTAQALGFDGAGDFFRSADGRLAPRGPDGAPFAYTGVHILDPGAVYAHEQRVFGLYPVWAQAAAKGRLFGELLDGDWMHVGDPAAREAAERRLAGDPP